MDVAVRRMGQDEFLEWGQHQDRKHELVDGTPVMMTFVNRRHDLVVVNLLVVFATRMTGRPCRIFTAETAVRIPKGNVRCPDLGIDCGEFVLKSVAADRPALVVEVLSPGTRTADLTVKLAEY